MLQLTGDHIDAGIWLVPLLELLLHQWGISAAVATPAQRLRVTDVVGSWTSEVGGCGLS